MSLSQEISRLSVAWKAPSAETPRLRKLLDMQRNLMDRGLIKRKEYSLLTPADDLYWHPKYAINQPCP
jgi:hypothetical protein